MRSSVYIEGSGGERVLIDAGPEFRLQAIKTGISHLDGVFLTHAHADHIHGLDDLRPLSRDEPLPVYGNEQTIVEMEERFPYIFGKCFGKHQKGGGKPRLTPRIADKPVQVGKLTIAPVPIKHGILDILGWEVLERPSADTIPQENSSKSFLYLTDASEIPLASMAQLKDRDSGMVRIVIIGSLRMRPHETHFTFDEALTAAMTMKAKAIFLTHICHNHSHEEIEEVCNTFKENHRDLINQNIDIHPAQDGLILTL
jgi:phosphoribosyl 1,2-cyclic phosphate phosphodiesterase